MLQRLVEVLLVPLNLALICIQLSVFLLALRRAKPGDTKQLSLQASAPGVLTGIGIFGTFLGIFLGLLNFDVTNIDKSVPALLQGMTTKFLTSVVGLGLALLFRFIMRSDLYAKTRPSPTTSLGDVAMRLDRIETGVREEGAATRAELAALRRSLTGDGEGPISEILQTLRKTLGGDGESTLVGQLKLLRQDQTDSFKKLGIQFDEFATQVSKLGSEAMIAALRDVIRDFNEKLSEQFGENFKELNSAVTRLVAWQQQYADQLSVMEQQFRSAAAGLEQSRAAVTEIATSAGRIPESMQLLRDGLGELDTQNGIMRQHLEAFSTLGSQAITAFPVIDKNIQALTTEFTQTVRAGIKDFQDSAAAQQGSLRSVSDGFDQLKGAMQKSVEQQATTVRALLDEYRTSIVALDTQLREVHSRAARDWQESLGKAVQSNQEVLEQNLRNLDTAIEAEIQKVANTLGRNLLGLHQKLVEDYQPLLTALRGIVEAGKRSAGSNNV